MHAFLHADVRVSGSTLVDTRLGLRYSLTPDAAWLVRQLLQDNCVETLAVAVARLKHIPLSEAKGAILTLLGQLGPHGVVVLRGYSVASWYTIWRWPRRYTTSAVSFLVACWRAYGFFLLPEAGFMLAYVTGQGLSGSWLCLPPLAVLSFMLHELGHIFAAHRCRVPVVMLARPGYMALLYKRPAARRARLIALMGPLSAAVLCLSGAFYGPIFVRIFLYALAGLHLLSLLPFLADGKTIWRTL